MSMTIKAAREAMPSWGLALLLAFMTLLTACSDSPPAQPTINVQPADTSAVSGTAATLSVTASGSDIGYQWQVSSDGGTSFANITGATGASYTTPTLGTPDSGKRYRVVISAAGISINSSAVTLTVTAAVVAPAITVAPAARSVTAPANATFSVTATGTAVTYQWQRSTDGGTTFVNITGATAATYDAGATGTSMNGERYRVVVSNASGSVTSAAAILTVNAAPAAAAFTTQPQNQAVIAGSAAAFSVAVTGVPAPTLQWQRSTDGGTTFANIVGAIDPTYNTGATSLSQDGERYRVNASNASGNAISSVATLTVNLAPQAPAISTQPTAQTVTAPATATFTAAASGVPTPTWQWQLSTDGGSTFANVTGATSANYTTPATATSDSSKRYRAVASNSAGSVNSNAALLTVTAAPAGKAWGTAALVGAAGDANNPQIAFAPNGDALALWGQVVNFTSNIMASRYTAAANSWGTAVAIGNGHLDAQIAIDANGNAIAVWMQSDGGRNNITANRYTAATNSWGTAQLIGSDSAGDALTPQIAIQPNGNAIAVWRQVSNTGQYIVANRYTAGVGWGTAQVITNNAVDAHDPQIAIDSNGNALTVWRQVDGATDNIWANLYTAATNSWGMAQLIETDNAGNASSPQIAIDTNGNAIAVWRQFSNTGATTMANRYTAAANSWGTAVPIETATGDFSVGHQIAIDVNGNAIAVWSQSDGTRSNIMANRYVAATNSWGMAQLIETVNSGNTVAPQIAIDTNGNAIAVWQQFGSRDGIPTNVWANRYTAGSGWGTAALIETATGQADAPQIAIDANGNAIAVWQQSDGLRTRIWANRYE